MKRREFITLIGGAALAWPLATSAQEAGRTYRVGGVSGSPRNAPFVTAMFDELRRAGFIEGQNLIVNWHQYGSRINMLSEFATEFVKAKVDVIYAAGEAPIRAAQQATATIPILGATDDMMEGGLVKSLARPEGNTTGISIFSPELDGKRQDILIEAVPGLRRIAALFDANATGPRKLKALDLAARARDIELSTHQIASPREIPAAIEAARAAGAEGLNVLASPILIGNHQIIIQHVAALRLPAIYQAPDEAEAGGFVAYGPRFVQIFRDLVAPQLIKLLRGVKPASIPIEQPTKFELVINLKTANALNIMVPQNLLANADKVIE
jgi:putative tryptophan/tyrosine transport system substrate-binding protein